MFTEQIEARIRQLQLKAEHEKRCGALYFDGWQRSLKDANYWYTEWQKVCADLGRVFAYVGHYNCEWHQEGDTCTCGLYALMDKYAIPR